MLSWPPTVRIYVCSDATDMRKGFDSLAYLVESSMALDPLSGHLLMSPSLAPSLGTRFLAHLLVLSGLYSEWRRQLGGGHRAAM